METDDGVWVRPMTGRIIAVALLGAAAASALALPRVFLRTAGRSAAAPPALAAPAPVTVVNVPSSLVTPSAPPLKHARHVGQPTLRVSGAAVRTPIVAHVAPHRVNLVVTSRPVVHVAPVRHVTPRAPAPRHTPAPPNTKPTPSTPTPTSTPAQTTPAGTQVAAPTEHVVQTQPQADQAAPTQTQPTQQDPGTQPATGDDGGTSTPAVPTPQVTKPGCPPSPSRTNGNGKAKGKAKGKARGNGNRG